MKKQKSVNGSLVRAGVLAAVYFFHLLFFQVIMVKPNDELSKQCKKLFSRKATLPKRDVAIAADYYTQLHKYSSTQQNPIPPIHDFAPTNVLCVYKHEQPQNSIEYLRSEHLPDDAFKIYLLNSTFLI